MYFFLQKMRTLIAQICTNYHYVRTWFILGECRFLLTVFFFTVVALAVFINVVVIFLLQILVPSLMRCLRSS